MLTPLFFRSRFSHSQIHYIHTHMHAYMQSFINKCKSS